MKISIIIPIYNRSHFLPRLFDSILKQNTKLLSIVLIDNNSTDTSWTLCENFVSLCSKKNINALLALEIKQGASACRNTGLQLATAPYVYFFDSDDELSDKFIEEISLRIEKEQYPEIICFRTNMYFNDGKVKIRNSLFSTDVADQIISSMLSTQSFVCKKEFFLQTNGWNENLPVWNDWEMGVRLLLIHPNLIWIKDKSYNKIYQHGDSLSGMSLNKVIPLRLKAMKMVYHSCSEMMKERKLMNSINCALTLKAQSQIVLLSSEYITEISQIIEFQKKISKSLLPHQRLILKVTLLLAKFRFKGLWRVYPLLFKAKSKKKGNSWTFFQ